MSANPEAIKSGRLRSDKQLSILRVKSIQIFGIFNQDNAILLMEFILRILLGLVTLICLAGGLNLLIKGTGSFLPKTFEPQPVLDNLFRFLSGIYFGLGFLMAWVLIHFQEQHELIYFIGLVVVFSGLGRLYSKIRVGAAGRYFDIMMVVEIILGLGIILMQYLRS